MGAAGEFRRGGALEAGGGLAWGAGGFFRVERKREMAALGALSAERGGAAPLQERGGCGTD